jgi:hypothetical protein
MPSCNCEHERWNTTSVQHIVVDIFENRHNPNDNNNRMECLHDFIAWCETQPDEYFPRYGIESMYSKVFLRELYRYLSESHFNQSTGEDLVTFMNSLLAQHGKPRSRYA